jgi:hypothetical protein
LKNAHGHTPGLGVSVAKDFKRNVAISGCLYRSAKSAITKANRLEMRRKIFILWIVQTQNKKEKYVR